MANSLDVLRSAGSNPALDLASLRDRRLSEMRRNLALAASDPRHFGTGATLPDVQDLESDIESDPNTGMDAAARIANIQRQNNALTDYNRPDTTAARNTEREYEMRKLGEPARIAGEANRDVARINAAGHVAGAREAAQAKPAQYVQTLDPETGMTRWTQKGEGLAGMFGPGTGEERGKIKGSKSVLDLIDEVEQLGAKTNWQGIGLTGPAQSALYRYLGMGNADEERLRGALSKLQAEASFGEGGKNLTGTEKEMIQKFTADTAMNPAAAQARLAEMRRMVQNKLLRGQGLAPSSNDLITDPNWGR